MTKAPLALAILVTLAAAETAEAQDACSPIMDDRVTLFITADGAVLVDGTEVALEALAAERSAAAERRREAGKDDAIVICGTTASFDIVMRVMEVIQDAGLENVFVTVAPADE